MDMRKRHHLRKRLKKASQHAEALSDLCDQQSVESRSVLDVKVIKHSSYNWKHGSLTSE